jgi:hypothetical protein
MKPAIKTLGEILYSPSQYVIPVFQRNYRWEEPEWAKLWDSLEEIRKPEKKGNHFMGFLVFVAGLAQPDNTPHSTSSMASSVSLRCRCCSPPSATSHGTSSKRNLPTRFISTT